MKRQSGKPGEGEIVKTTIRLPRPLWDKLRHRAVDENTDLQTLVARALTAYLKGSQQ
jgi:predicted DNA-binding ribbon-helix-helix protein